MNRIIQFSHPDNPEEEEGEEMEKTKESADMLQTGEIIEEK